MPYNASVPYALRLLQYLFDLPINSTCCQSAGYCGAQYSTNVQFVWGVPKANLTLPWGGGEVSVNALPRPPTAAAASGSSSEAIDDGGCDVGGDDGVGYFTHADLRAALGRGVIEAHAHAGGHIHLEPDDIARMPAEARGRLERYGARAGASSFNASIVQLIPCHVMTSRMMGLLTPLRNQKDFIGSMQQCNRAVAQLEGLLPTVSLEAMGLSGCVRRSWGREEAGVPPTALRSPPLPRSYGSNARGYVGVYGDNLHTQWLAPAPGGAAFMYSLTFVFYEQARAPSPPMAQDVGSLPPSASPPCPPIAVRLHPRCRARERPPRRRMRVRRRAPHHAPRRRHHDGARRPLYHDRHPGLHLDDKPQSVRGCKRGASPHDQPRTPPALPSAVQPRPRRHGPLRRRHQRRLGRQPRRRDWPRRRVLHPHPLGLLGGACAREGGGLV